MLKCDIPVRRPGSGAEKNGRKKNDGTAMMTKIWIVALLLIGTVPGPECAAAAACGPPPARMFQALETQAENDPRNAGIWARLGYVNIAEGESVDRVRLRNDNRVMPLEFEGRCEDFDVSFYDSGAPKEYRSRLQIVENGKIVAYNHLKILEISNKTSHGGTILH
jgi:hypothetical protein